MQIETGPLFSEKGIANEVSENNSFIVDPLSSSNAEQEQENLNKMDPMLASSNKIAQSGYISLHPSSSSYPLMCHPSTIPAQQSFIAGGAGYIPGMGLIPLTSQVCYPPVFPGYSYGYQSASPFKIFDGQGGSYFTVSAQFPLGSVVCSPFQVLPAYVPYPPVVQEVLNWDENHRFNKQGRYCYCRKDISPPDPVLQCVLCKDWFHPGCLAKLERPIYHGEYRYFTFSCANCNSGVEVLKEHCRNWVQTGQIALLHLIITKRQMWFRMREIADFLEEHWKDLCERHHTRHPRWVCILGNAFSFRKEHSFSRQTNTPFSFLRSEDLGLSRGYWTFKNLLTHFPEAAGMELEDNLSGITTKTTNGGKQTSSQSRRPAKQAEGNASGKRPRKSTATPDESDPKCRRGEDSDEAEDQDPQEEEEDDEEKERESETEATSGDHPSRGTDESLYFGINSATPSGAAADGASSVPKASPATAAGGGLYRSGSVDSGTEVEDVVGVAGGGTGEEPTPVVGEDSGLLHFTASASQPPLPHHHHHHHYQDYGRLLGDEDSHELMVGDTSPSAVAASGGSSVDSIYHHPHHHAHHQPHHHGLSSEPSPTSQADDVLALSGLGGSEGENFLLPPRHHHNHHPAHLPLQEQLTSYQQFLDAFGSGGGVGTSLDSCSYGSASATVGGEDSSPSAAAAGQVDLCNPSLHTQQQA